MELSTFCAGEKKHSLQDWSSSLQSIINNSQLVPLPIFCDRFCYISKDYIFL